MKMLLGLLVLAVSLAGFLKGSLAVAAADLPIFDNDDSNVVFNGADLTPPAPSLGEFDRRVLEVCGPLTGWLDRDRFSRFVYQENDQIFRQMYKEVNGVEASASVDDSQLTAFKQEFDRLWWRAQGFKHIFCGELHSGRGGQAQLGGLHYIGRYVQLSESGQISQLPPERCMPETQPGLVYTLGINFTTADGRHGSKCKNGYGYRLDAYRYFVEAMRAYRAMKQSNSHEAACRYRIDSEAGSYWTIYVTKKDAIRTFYTVKLNERICQRNQVVCDPQKGVYRQPVDDCLQAAN